MGLTNIFKKSNTKDALSVIQSGKNNSQPFHILDGYVPLATPELRMYRALREAVPVIDSAIFKLIRLVCNFEIKCQDKTAEHRLNTFMRTVPVSGNQYGLNAFLSTYFEELLTYGTSIGEIVTTQAGEFAALYNADLENIQLKRNSNCFDIDVFVSNGAESTPVPNQNLILLSTLNPSAGQIAGNSLLKGLPFVSSILLKIYNTIGINWERVGNVRFAVTYKPQNDALDKAYARDRAMQIASEWSSAMQSGSSVKDFVAVGDVSIKVIGADNQVLDSEIPVRQMLEQIVAKTGLPPFMLGLSWSSTERMSSQQADVLTSELEAYRRILEPILLKICNTYLRLNGYGCTAEIEWDDIMLQDVVELSKARLYNAQALQLEKLNERSETIEQKL